MWNSPVLIPLKTFKAIDHILNSFVWGTNRHKLAWHTLKNPTSSGGTALPDLHAYYIAAQLSHIYHLHKTDSIRYQSLTCKKPNSVAHSPLQVIFRGRGNRGGWAAQNPLLHQHKSIWESALKLIGADFFHTHTPLWHNPQLPELMRMWGATTWATKGIVYLFQVISPLGIRSFQSLQDEFELPLPSPRLSDRLTQLYIIHRSYLTPARLTKFRPD